MKSLPPLLTCLLALPLLMGAKCGDDLKIGLKSDPTDTVFFGDASNGASWLGRPVTINQDGTVKLRNYPTSFTWADRCAANAPAGSENIGTITEQALNNSFNAAALRDSISGLENRDFWKKVRENRLFITAPNATEAEFIALFENTPVVQQKAKFAFRLLRSNEITQQDLEPSAFLGFSRSSFDAAAGAKIGDRVSAGLELERVNMNFVVASKWGRLTLSNRVKDCLLAAASSMNPKPTHIVDGVTLGVLFRSSFEGRGFKTEAGVNANEVTASAKVDAGDMRIDAALYGQIMPQNYKSNFFDIYKNNSTPAETQIINYFSDLSKSIETPVFISAHLTPVE